jgi:hypothetical protein
LVAKPDHIVAASIQQQVVNNNEEKVRAVGNTADQKWSKSKPAKQLMEIAFLSDFKVSLRKIGPTAITTAIRYKDQAIVSAYYHHNFWKTTKEEERNKLNSVNSSYADSDKENYPTCLEYTSSINRCNKGYLQRKSTEDGTVQYKNEISSFFTNAENLFRQKRWSSIIHPSSIHPSK